MSTPSRYDTIACKYVHRSFATPNCMYGYDKRDGSPLWHGPHGWHVCDQGRAWQYAVKHAILQTRAPKAAFDAVAWRWHPKEWF